MSDKRESQKTIEDNTNDNTSDTEKRNFGDTFNRVWADTIDNVLSELDFRLKCLREKREKSPDAIMAVCEVTRMLDTLQSCTEEVQLLIQVEEQAHRLRQKIQQKQENRDKIQQKS